MRVTKFLGTQQINPRERQNKGQLVKRLIWGSMEMLSKTQPLWNRYSSTVASSPRTCTGASTESCNGGQGSMAP